ncbi:MAG: DMT family transporter [Desulfarculus sp.]|jgi:drug/metabolite transporter (DMT)-like permease|nr:MAG: DMT family transporter [Desulfarculus sp.]
MAGVPFNREDAVQTPDATPRLGYFLLATITVFWGLNFPAMKVVLGELPPWTFRTLCLILGGLGLLLICRLGGLPLAIPRADLKPLFWSTLFNITGWHLTSAYGLIHMQAGRAMIIGYTMPVWASLLAYFLLGERLGPRRILGLVLGVAGLLVLLWPNLSQVQASPVGAAFMLAAAWCWAAGTIWIKRGPWSMPLILVAAWMFLLGGLPVLIGALILESPAAVTNLSWTGGLVLAYVIALPVLFCHWAYYKLVSIFPVSLAALGMLATPVLGVLVSAWALKEPLGWPEITSLVLVVAALAIVMIRPSGQAAVNHKALAQPD